MAKLVSATYGDALFDLALELDITDSLFEEAKGILAAFQTNEELTDFLNHPKINRDEKIQVIENIFQTAVSKEMTGFLVTILTKGRSRDLEKIFDYFIAKVKEYKRIGTAYIQTPLELSEAMKTVVKERLLQTTGYQEVEMEFSVEPELIGGMVIRVGDRVIDSSIRNRLSELSKQLYKLDVIQ